jgi:outer membrane protein TolC
VQEIKAQLRQVLALPQETALDVNDAPPPEMPEGDLPQLIDVAQSVRPEVAVAENGLRIAELNLRLAKRELAPSVALTGQYTRQTAAGFTGEEYSWQIGVMAEKPILDGGVKDGKVTSARARVEEAELQVEQAQEQVALEVVQAWLAIQEAEERIVTAQQGLVEARERRRMAQLRYREGLAAGIEVIDADTALAAAEARLVNAEYDRQLAVTQLRTAMGITVAPRQEGETQ